MVFLLSVDREKDDWDKLIKLTKYGLILPGFTDDSRLVKIAEMILAGKAVKELKSGSIIPPMKEE
jgi:hypothetical protein